MLLVRLHPDDTADGQHPLPLGRSPTPLRHTSMPEQPVPLAREASILFRPGQDKDTGSLPSGHPLLDRLPQAVHRKPNSNGKVKTENGKVKTENGRLRVSESNQTCLNCRVEAGSTKSKRKTITISITMPHHPLYIINLIPRRHGGLEIFGRFVFIGIKQIYLNLCQSRQISVILWSIFSSSSLTTHPLTPRPS